MAISNFFFRVEYQNKEFFFQALRITFLRSLVFCLFSCRSVMRFEVFMCACLSVFVSLSNGWNKGLWELDGISQDSVSFFFYFACKDFNSRGLLGIVCFRLPYSGRSR